MRRRRGIKKTIEEEDAAMGFGDWGTYFDAKKAKLLDQFQLAVLDHEKKSDIFQNIAIFVNGLTKPNASELKQLMAEHGGTYHSYQMGNTTHIIASNLPNVKIKQLGSVPIVKPTWITDSIELGKLLDYKRYLLYTNQSAFQPALSFPVVEKSTSLGLPAESKGKPEHESRGKPEHESRGKPEHESRGKLEHESMGKAEYESKRKPEYESREKSENESRGKPEHESRGKREHDSWAKPELNSTTFTGESSRGPTKTASDPKFLEEFYNNSRLHLIATLGAEFKLLVSQMRDKFDGKFPGLEKLIKEKGKATSRIYPGSVIMHIDMDCFFVSVGLKTRPELRGKPVAVTHARNAQHFRPGRTNDVVQNTDRIPLCEQEVVDAHSSMSEIACCSYEARKCGIRNGMFLGSAVKLCPELKTIQYDFQGYKDVSTVLYNTIASYTLDIEAVSCDEMYVDVTHILKVTGLTVDEWASHIRQEIMGATGCPCSTGFGANRLQARLATKKAKPNGQFYLQADDVEVYMSEIALADLPGVGRATLAKLKNLGVTTCGDVQTASLSVLQAELGPKAGETLMEQSKGVDRRPLNFHHERKSVSAEVNYGIRFKNQGESYTFLQSLSTEVCNRLCDIGMRAKCVTLKLMIRSADAPVETAKFLGHGICDSLSKSSTLNTAIADDKSIYREAKCLYDKLNPPFTDLRGVGIQLSKLEKGGASSATTLTKFLQQSIPGSSGVKLSSTTIKDAVVPTAVTNVSNGSSNLTAANEKVTGMKQKSIPVSTRGGKRGRPKGSTTKKRDKPISVGNYFKISATTSQSTKTVKNVESTPNIDISVLNELPEDIRNEIIKEYNLNLTSGGLASVTNKGASTKFTPAPSTSIGVASTNLANVASTSADAATSVKVAPTSVKVAPTSANVASITLENVASTSADSATSVNVAPTSANVASTSANVAPTSANVAPTSAKIAPTSANIAPTSANIAPTSANVPSTTSTTVTSSPFENLTWDELKPIIKIWLKCEREPKAIDVKMIAEHFRQLAIKRKIEMLKVIFNFLHRNVASMNCKWHEAYFTMVSVMQEGMVARYGKTLLVERSFNCCSIDK